MRSGRPCASHAVCTAFATKATAPIWSAFSVAARAKARRMVTRMTETDVASTDANKENEDWVACMALIRDAGDEAAFARLFGHFAPRVKAFLMRSGADAALAEEVAQEAMLRASGLPHTILRITSGLITWAGFMLIVLRSTRRSRHTNARRRWNRITRPPFSL